MKSVRLEWRIQSSLCDTLGLLSHSLTAFQIHFFSSLLWRSVDGYSLPFIDGKLDGRWFVQGDKLVGRTVGRGLCVCVFLPLFLSWWIMKRAASEQVEVPLGLSRLCTALLNMPWNLRQRQIVSGQPECRSQYSSSELLWRNQWLMWKCPGIRPHLLSEILGNLELDLWISVLTFGSHWPWFWR